MENRLNQTVVCCDYVSQIINCNSRILCDGSKIYLNAPTGSGKTFALNNIIKTLNYYQGGKYLYICNRTSLVEQEKKELGKKSILYTTNGNDRLVDTGYYPNIVVTTYQSIENGIIMGNINSDYFNEFKFIVLDEIHYILSDATFNSNTNLIYNLILNHRKGVMVLISATGNDVFKIVEQYSPILYDNNKRMIKNHYINILKKDMNQGKFYRFKDFTLLIDKIKERVDEKWIIFVTTKTKGKEIKKALKEMDIKTEYLDATCTDKKVYNEIVSQSKFDAQVIVSTSIIDNGIHIKDPMVKHVVLFSNFKNEIKQMYGRKRLLNINDSFDVYIYDTSKKELDKLINTLIQQRKELIEWKNQFYKYGMVLPLYDADSIQGKKYRKAFCRTNKGFIFNEFGLLQLDFMLIDIYNLYQSNDVFEEKLHWLVTTYNKNQFTSKKNQFLQKAIIQCGEIRGDLFEKIYKQYGDREVKNSEYENLCIEINKVFRENFRDDKCFRNNRIPKLGAINEGFKRHNIDYKIYRYNNGYCLEKLKTDYS
jgi:hypothetical protein